MKWIGHEKSRTLPCPSNLVDDRARSRSSPENLTEYERALLENFERYQALVQATPGVIFETDAQGHNTFVSERWAQWTGLTPEETAGRDWLRAVPPEDIAGEESRWRAIWRTDQVIVYRSRLRTADGSGRWVLVRALPTRDRQGNIVRWTGTLTDINDLVQAQEALRTKEAELSLVMDAVPALIAYVNTDGCYLRVNRNYAQWFGSTVEEIQGKRMSDVLGEEQWKQIKPWVEKVLSGETITYERQLPFQRGDRRWIRASYTPDVNERGRIKGFVVHVIDIEVIKKAEEAKRASEENYRRIVETANEGIVIGTLDGKITFINQKWADMLGYSKEEILGKFDPDFMDEEQKALVLDTRQKLQSQKKGSGEYKFRRKDGSEFWTLWSASLFQDQEGENVGYIAMHADITDRKQVEQALKESEERYRHLFEEDLTGDFLAAADGTILLCNSAFLRIYGFSSREEALGTNLADLYLQGEDWDALLRMLKQERILERYTGYHRRRDGEIIQVVENLVGTFTRQGALQQITGYVFDDTAHRRTEKALFDSRDDLNRAQAVARTGSWRLNIQRNELLWSDENHRIFGSLGGPR